MCPCAQAVGSSTVRLLAWLTVAWLLWYVKVATVVLLMTEYNSDNDDVVVVDGYGNGNSYADGNYRLYIIMLGVGRRTITSN